MKNCHSHIIPLILRLHRLFFNFVAFCCVVGEKMKNLIQKCRAIFYFYSFFSFSSSTWIFKIACNSIQIKTKTKRERRKKWKIYRSNFPLLSRNAHACFFPLLYQCVCKWKIHERVYRDAIAMHSRELQCFSFFFTCDYEIKNLEILFLCVECTFLSDSVFFFFLRKILHFCWFLKSTKFHFFSIFSLF